MTFFCWLKKVKKTCNRGVTTAKTKGWGLQKLAEMQAERGGEAVFFSCTDSTGRRGGGPFLFSSCNLLRKVATQNLE